jgi:hypothetical protein
VPTEAVDWPGCRSCIHWVSDQYTTPNGWCRIHETPTTIDDGCHSHDGAFETGDMAGMALCERRCMKCRRVSVYSAWNGGQECCPHCD